MHYQKYLIYKEPTDDRLMVYTKLTGPKRQPETEWVDQKLDYMSVLIPVVYTMSNGRRSAEIPFLHQGRQLIVFDDRVIWDATINHVRYSSSTVGTLVNESLESFKKYSTFTRMIDRVEVELIGITSYPEKSEKWFEFQVMLGALRKKEGCM